MLQFDKFSIVVLLCAIIATLFLVNVDRVSVPVSPTLPSDSVGFAAHPLSSSFSSAEPGARVTGSQLSVSDNIVYRKGWYSINGSSWVSFNMSGASYNGNANWLRGYASRSLPTFGLGEHYVLIYSCNRSNNAWDCHGNRLQLIVINNTGSSGSGSDGGSFDGGGDSSGNLCNVSIDCLSNEYCFNGVCLLNVSGHTYFVATNGNDSWSGNFTHPWKTWEKAFTSQSVNPGDIVYFRGGVYPTTVKTGLGIEPTRNGTVNNWIVYANYPDETPILDCGDIVASDIRYTGLRNVGIEFYDIYYVKVVGLTVRNVKQYYNRNYGVGIRVSGGNMVLERCTVYNIWGHGFETWFGDRAGDKVYFINCDAYNCNDLISGDPLGSNAGNTGAGFSLWDRGTEALGEVHLYDCRSWNSSDQGFQTGASHYVKVTGCWSFWNEAYVIGGGTGWKMGWMEYEAQPKEYFNNLAVCNDGSGFFTNEWYGVDVPGIEFYNNLAYKNGNGPNGGVGISISQLESGYTDDELLRIFKDNIAYDNNQGEIHLRGSASYTHDHNSWDSSVSVNDNDFVSLNCSQLIQPRKSDGSLPDITFGHLAEGSDLIDGGAVVPGYHCSTPGTHPGEDCVEWYGAAPDLGPFESNYGTEVPVEDCGCADGYYCLHDTCLLNVSGHTYFVATNGNDVWSGNFTHPWKTWSKAFHTAQAGDIVYFRGGIYYSEVTDGTGIKYIPEQSGLGYNGNAENPIKYFNYPEEIPILDCSNSFLTGETVYTSKALYLNNVDYVHIKGLQIQNLFQRETPNSQGDYDIITAFEITNCNNTIIENCVVHDVDGIAFRTMGAKIVDIINCDAYNNCDYHHKTLPGSYGSGFSISGASDGTGIVTLTGCRAWQCGDQGFTSPWEGKTVFNNCWSFNNGLAQGSGNGFKTSANSVENNSYAALREFYNCISADNGNPAAEYSGDGFTTNDNNRNGYNVSYYNCLSYSDERFGFVSYVTTIPGNRLWKNNIAYNAGNRNNDLQGTINTEIRNSWNSGTGVTVSDADFSNLDFSQLIAPRKADGSLPDITFGHLASGSDLIDAGTIVSGYHCSTPGAHPGADCREWYGAAPDLGPFESNYSYTMPLSCSGSSTRSCNIPNGTGIQSMTCNTTTGVYGSPYGTCNLTTCNTNYFINGSVCSYALCAGSNNRSCNIPNGTGIQYRTCTNGSWSAYSSTCTRVSCNTGFTPCGTGCNQTYRSCQITNGISNQTGYCSSGVWRWNACSVQSCNSGYVPIGNTCILYVPPATTGAIIADHNAARDFDTIPKCWLDRAKSLYAFTYHHTSHGSQVVSGMDYLRTYVNSSLYAYGTSGQGSYLYFDDNYDTDLGNGDWPTITGSDLDADSRLNTAMWSWCGQVESYPTDALMSPHYLVPAEELVTGRGIDFVYMTGHLDGSGPTGSVYVANNLIRQHVMDVGGVLFDFADIESYDPAGNYYPQGSDACEWCTTWCATHEEYDCDELPIGCAHSHPFNCVQKGRAYWWMLARVAGWNGSATHTCN